jgi:hypothetical protein
MKEFEYKDVRGSESLNLPRQLDTFESPGAKTLKDRYIFDFSTPMIRSGGGEVGEWLWDNFTQNDEAWDFYSGSPGNASLMVDGLPKWSDDYPRSESDGLVQQYTADIFGNEVAPYFDENSLIYIDEASVGVYGQGGFGAPPNYLKNFRSGYIEFTLKTDKKNCIIGMGTAKYVNYTGNFRQFTTGGSEAERSGPALAIGSSTTIDSSSSYLNEDLVNVDSLYVNLNNGKIELSYKNEYGETQKDFKILGNTDIADGQWHHVVINFGKPGTLKTLSKKHNNRFIEIWIDGQIDKRDTEYVNKYQVFFPLVEWLLMDPLLIENEQTDEFWRTPYISQVAGSGVNLFGNISNRVFDNATSNAFRGSMNHFMSGINYALSPYQIQQRNRLYRGYTQNTAKSSTAVCELVQPTVYGNKKKALKLFWNNLVDSGKDGIELDDNFAVSSFSVTHKTVNSATDINNIDVAIERPIKYLQDVRVVLRDNIFIFGPGLESLFSKPEVWAAQIGEQQQFNAAWIGNFDGLNSVDADFSTEIKSRFTSSAIKNITYSGIDLKSGDRILLTNQFNPRDNGIYVFNGAGNPLTRADDADSYEKLNNAVVRIVDGYYKDTSWMLSNQISSLNDKQEWSELEYHPSSENIGAQPIFKTRWSNESGIERFIDLESDLNINQYDIIVFMNYPETDNDIENSFVGFEKTETFKKYNDFIKSLSNVVANGANLYVSSTKLAEDLKIVKRFTKISQAITSSDAQSAAISPFEVSEPEDLYFNTHRQNMYHLNEEIPGLTNRETYILTDFINYVPASSGSIEQYHAKYSYKQLGLTEGSEFFIPGFALRKIATNEKLPGLNANQSRTDDFYVVAPQDVLTGTVLTGLANNLYSGDDLVANPYDDHATTIIVHNGQLLNGQPINGKIFMNCIEDGYTFSREEYNKAIIQTIPQNEISENTSTRAWQYSTTRLNRLPQRVNVREMTKYGQTTPTNGGGGPFIQSQTNSSNGIIRSGTDKNNIDYQSDLYPKVEEEIYPIQEVPVLSMTWLGLQWLAE